MSKFSTFALTIRPKEGIVDDDIDKTMGFIRRVAEYYHVVTEKTGSERHIHAAVVLKTACSKGEMCTRVLRLFKLLSPEEKNVLRHGVKIMYNMDFITKYLDKDDDTVVVASCLPESGTVESYFPPKPVELTEGKLRKCSVYYHELERMWYENRQPHHETSTRCTRDFLFEMMYSKRCLPVIRDDKQIIQTSRHLTRWLNKTSSSTIDLPPFEKEED